MPTPTPEQMVAEFDQMEAQVLGVLRGMPDCALASFYATAAAANNAAAITAATLGGGQAVALMYSLEVLEIAREKIRRMEGAQHGDD